MTPVVIDASAFAALVFNEPRQAQVAARLEGVPVFAPTLLKYELANAALTKARAQPVHATAIFRALAVALDPQAQITWMDVEPTDVALLARATGLSAYDASYLWLAGWLGADLLTFDRDLAWTGVSPGPGQDSDGDDEDE